MAGETNISLGDGGFKATRENALSLVKTMFASDTGYVAKHVVLLMWRGPIAGELNHRSGGFMDFNEAQQFADSLAKKYEDLGLPFTVYLDGDHYRSKDEDKILDD